MPDPGPPPDAKEVNWEPGLGPPREIEWRPGMEPPTSRAGALIQEPTSDPNRGMSVKSLTGMFRGVGGVEETAALERALRANGGDWVHMTSSNVAGAVRDWEKDIFFIKFNNGHVYYYPGRGEGEYNGLLAAGSKGKYVHEVVRDGDTDIRVYGIMPFTI